MKENITSSHHTPHACLGIFLETTTSLSFFSGREHITSRNKSSSYQKSNNTLAPLDSVIYLQWIFIMLGMPWHAVAERVVRCCGTCSSIKKQCRYLRKISLRCHRTHSLCVFHLVVLNTLLSSSLACEALCDDKSHTHM